MLIRKAFKFEITPNGQQTHKMKQFSGCSRFVFNKALAYQNEFKNYTWIYYMDKIFSIPHKIRSATHISIDMNL